MKDAAAAKLAAQESTQALFGRLRAALAEYGVHDFAVYSMDGSEARLAFSSGTAACAGVAVDRLPLGAVSGLASFLAGAGPTVLDAQGAIEPALAQCLESLGADTLLRLGFEGRAVGLVVIYKVAGSKPRALPADEIASLVTLLANAFAQRRTIETLRRDGARVASKLNELQRALTLLLLTDREQLMGTLLGRALQLVASPRGLLLIGSAQELRTEHRIGEIDAEQTVEMATVAERCYATRLPCALSSLSGEWIEQFDVESIHIASTAAFPIKGGAELLGCVVAFDATIALEALELLDATLLAGATAIQSFRNSQRMLDEQRLGEQLRLAAQMQERLLPAAGVQVRNLSVAHYSRYCDEAGGDYVDAIPHSPHLCTFAVGDVSGHGIGAALRMVDLRARLQSYLTARRWSDLTELAARLNGDLCRECAPGEFVTLFAGTLDTITGVLQYVGAGHEYPLLYRAEQRSFEELASTGLPLGLESHATYEARATLLCPGDVLVVLTDGATEARDANGKAFGTEAIRTALQSLADQGAPRILESLVQSTLAHRGGLAFTDDVTYLVVKVEKVPLRLLPGASPAVHDELVYDQRLPCTLADKERSVQGLAATLSGRVDESELSSLLMAAEEAITNAVVHGNHEDATRTIDLRLHLGRQATLLLSHAGEPFDPVQCFPRHSDEEAIGRESGRGLMILASLVDQVLYFDAGRSVMLVKSLPQGSAAPPTI